MDPVYVVLIISFGLIFMATATITICALPGWIKIPYSYNDILDWITRVDSQIVPYLKRVEFIRDELLLASKNEFDIINSVFFLN